MAQFTLTGTRDGQPLSLTWDDGQLSGDPGAVAEVQALAQAYDGQPVAGSLSPATHTAAEHLASPTSAYALAQLAFDDMPTLHGEVPGLAFDDVGTWKGPDEHE